MSTDPQSSVQVRRDGAVCILTLNRPERRNALNTEVCEALLAAAHSAVADGVRCLVVTGEGTAFCSGADLKDVYGKTFIDALYAMLHGLSKLPIVVIAAVNGPAIGAGTQLAIACDVRVADATAKFAVPTPRNGMAVDAWTVRTLGDIAGHGLARRLLLGAETLDLSEARGYGLVDRVGSLEDAISWAHEIAEFAPMTLAYNKLVLNGWASDEQIAERFDAVWASDDVQEAAVARSEKRAPRFIGR
jgi:enoyl-CoA hydratase